MLNRAKIALVLSLLCVMVACPSCADTPSDGGWVVTLEKPLPGEKDLKLRIARDPNGKLVGFATARTFNSFWHEAATDRLTLSDDGLAGVTKVTIRPDPWMPRDGKPIACEFRLRADRSDAALGGTYAGTVGGKKVRGRLRGQPAAVEGDAAGRNFRIRFFQPLRALLASRRNLPNQNYAHDHLLLFTLTGGGEVEGAQFESVVPDYRSYSSVVRSLEVDLDGPVLTGRAVIDIDHGRDDNRVPRAVMTHTYTFRGLVIGGEVALQYDAKVGDIHDRNLMAWGSMHRTPAPKPAQSIATIRLPRAMRENSPIILTLALDDDGPIHGLAYASGWNHQPHSVDASKLVLEGDRLRGLLKLSIVPDVYKSQKEPFEVTAEIDATIDGYALAGTFTTRDGEQEVEGALTGRLSRREPPAVTDDTLGSMTIHFGWSLVGGKGGRDHQMQAELTLEDGKVVSARVSNPKRPDALQAKVTEARFEIEGSRLTGVLEFEARSKVVSAGTYRYEIHGIIDGGKFFGYWRGWHEGRSILTKSSKVSGTVSARSEG